MKVIKPIFMLFLMMILAVISWEIAGRIKRTEAEQKVFLDLAEVVRVGDSYQESEVRSADIHDISQTEVLLEIQEGLKTLAEENPDFQGWLTISGTSIDYPVMMRVGEPEYYLHRDFYGNDSYSGTPFITYGEGNPLSPVIIICGHHMRNGSMFSDLLKYREPKFLEEHGMIQFESLSRRYEYQIIAAGYLQDVSEESKGFQIRELFVEYDNSRILELLNPEAVQYNEMQIKNDGMIIILVTCSYEQENGRYAVIGQLQR